MSFRRVFWAWLACRYLGGLDQQTIAEEFVKGLADFAYAAIVIGIARGILVIAEGGMIIDTILQAASLLRSPVHPPPSTPRLCISSLACSLCWFLRVLDLRRSPCPSWVR